MKDDSGFSLVRKVIKVIISGYRSIMRLKNMDHSIIGNWGQQVAWNLSIDMVVLTFPEEFEDEGFSCTRNSYS